MAITPALGCAAGSNANGSGGSGGAGGAGGAQSSTSSSSSSGSAMPDAGGADSGQGGLGEQACPAGKFATGIDDKQKLVCAALDDLVRTAVNDQCSAYLGWRDGCGACTTDPSKWGWAAANSCSNGAQPGDSCTTTNLAGNSVKLFGLDTDGNVNDDDRFYVGLHCNPGDDQSGAGPCGPGQLLTKISGGDVTCTPASGALLSYVRASCSIYFGWRDGCDGCTTAPTKWGRVSSTSCDIGSGADNSCTTAMLGSDSVQLLGISPDGDVDDDDKFYVGLHCVAPTKKGGPVMGACPAGQFVTGVHADGSVECATPDPLVATYLGTKWVLYLGWRDSCSGCSDPPTKWGRVRSDVCTADLGLNDTCSMTKLGTETVQLFGLNTDGNVDDSDKFYLGLGCL